MKLWESIKKNKKKTVFAVVGVAVVSVVVGSRVLGASAALPVETATVSRGDLSVDIEINGTIQSNSLKSYYSDVDCKIGKVNVKPGDMVKKGDILISYDEDDLAYRTEMAAYNAQSVEGSYNDRVQSSKRIAGLYSEAAGSLKTLDEQIMIYETAIRDLDHQITQKRASLADFGAKLQVSLIDWADRPDSEEYENLQKMVQTNAYEQNYNSDLIDMQQTRDLYSQTLSELKQKQSEMKSQKTSTYTSLMTDGGKEQLEADKASNNLSIANDTERLTKAADGIRADFDGVVTKVYVTEGSTVSKCAQLVDIESNEDVRVKSSVNKYDLEYLEEGQEAVVKIRNRDYNGRIEKIDHMVTREANGSSGTGVVINIQDSDENVVLGLEAKATVRAVSLENVLVIPKIALYSDTEGEYVYAVKDGKAVKTPVEAGVSNSEDIVIEGGLDAGDVVIVNKVGKIEITDGMDVKGTDVSAK